MSRCACRCAATVTACAAPLEGGHPGTVGGAWVNPGAPDERWLEARHGDEILQPGDVVRLVRGGGGGFGDPHHRDPRQVRDDLENGYVTPAAAREVYGLADLSGPPLTSALLPGSSGRSRDRPAVAPAVGRTPASSPPRTVPPPRRPRRAADGLPGLLIEVVDLLGQRPVRPGLVDQDADRGLAVRGIVEKLGSLHVGAQKAHEQGPVLLRPVAPDGCHGVLEVVHVVG